MKKAIFVLLMSMAAASQTFAASRYVEIVPQDVPITVELPGRVSALVISEVRPQVDGIVIERLFEEGDDVKKGQALYRIDSDIYRARRDRAKGALDEALANAEDARRVESRRKNLSRSKAVSQQDLDSAIYGRMQAEARIAIAKAELQAAEIDLAHTEIKAHSDGRIGISRVHPGSLVTANQIAPLNVVQKIDKVYVDVQRSADDTRPARNVAVKGRDNKLENMFTDITVGPDTGDVTLRAVFDNPDANLLPGAYVTAILDLGTREKAILVPQKAVLSGPGGTHYLFVLEPVDGKYKLSRRTVSVGEAYGNAWIVEKGLSGGEKVLAEGLQRAADGEVIESEEEKWTVSKE